MNTRNKLLVLIGNNKNKLGLHQIFMCLGGWLHSDIMIPISIRKYGKIIFNELLNTPMLQSLRISSTLFRYCNIITPIFVDHFVKDISMRKIIIKSYNKSITKTETYILSDKTRKLNNIIIINSFHFHSY